MTLIAPSVLSADFLNLGRDIEMLNDSEADWFHLDVMDGMFVPNISYGMSIIAAIKKVAKKPLDVHLMIQEPSRYVEAFAKAGADILTVHYEAETHLHRTIQAIRGADMKVGVALNPHTSISVLEDIISELDLVLLMSVNPGFGGQKFIPQTIEKIKKLKALNHYNGMHPLIEVDGGITLENASFIIEAGADVMVAGNTVFSSPDPTSIISELKRIK